MTVEQIMRTIDEATAPKVMSQQEALDFLEELAADLESRMDALRGEIANGNGD